MIKLYAFFFFFCMCPIQCIHDCTRFRENIIEIYENIQTDFFLVYCHTLGLEKTWPRKLIRPRILYWNIIRSSNCITWKSRSTRVHGGEKKNVYTLLVCSTFHWPHGRIRAPLRDINKIIFKKKKTISV